MVASDPLDPAEGGPGVKLDAAGGRAGQPVSRVFVVEPHPVTRRGVCRMIGSTPGFVLAGTAGTLDEAVERIPDDESISLILVEPLVAPHHERALLEALARAAPGAKVMALSARVEVGYVGRILEEAAGYVSKNEPTLVILDAIRGVLEGKTIVAGVPGRPA